MTAPKSGELATDAFLRIVVYIVATVVTALLVYYVLLGVSFAFGDTLECGTSDTCSALGDFLDTWWQSDVVCLLIGALIAWPLFRPMRR